MDKRVLRDLVWEWDPIGLGDDRKFTEDEYDCILDGAVSLLVRGGTAEELVEHLNAELPDHFGLTPQPEEAKAFAQRLTAWWMARAAERDAP